MTPPVAPPEKPRLRVPHRRLLLVLLLLSGIWYQLQARAPRPAAPDPDDGGRTTVVFAASGRNLAADESAGGHTLARHVGRSDAELAARLAAEPGLAAASAFTDRPTAERAVAAALAAERRRVDDWRARGRGETLAIAWRGDGAPVGRLLERGAPRAEEVSGVRVVLRRDSESFFVLTAYPERPR
jgi:hypothetical protein